MIFLVIVGTQKRGVAPFLVTQKFGVAQFLCNQKCGVAPYLVTQISEFLLLLCKYSFKWIKKSLNYKITTKMNQLHNLGSKKWSDSAFLGHEKLSGSMLLGYEKWSYSGFLGYNYCDQYLVFSFCSMILERYKKQPYTFDH